MHALRTALFLALSAAAQPLTAELLAAAPRYKMVLSADKAEHGVSCVSFVENPAIQRGWVALAAAVAPQPSLLKLSGEDQEQVVTGPALVPGLEILRLDAKGQPYYISFDAATIRAAQLRFAEQGKHTSTNEGHSIALSGNTVFESWIVRDPERDPATTLGYTPEQIPAGTWMLSAKVPDAATWAKVQSGELTGFSIEALFDAEELKLAAAAATPLPTMKKPWYARLSAAALAVLGLSEIETKDGKKFDVAEDGTVSEVDADGNITGPAPDGEYELPDGTMLVVKGGKKEATSAPGSSDANPKMADEAVTAAMDLLKGLSDTTTAEEAKAILEKALEAVGAKPADPKPEDVKMAAVSLFLETVEMADGSTFTYNPITRRLTDATGAVVQTGEYACKDGSYFRCNTEQWTTQISKGDFEAGQTSATKLAAVEVELATAKAELAKSPAGLPVTLGGDGGKLADAKPTSRVAVALSRVEELRARRQNAVQE